MKVHIRKSSWDDEASSLAKRTVIYDVFLPVDKYIHIYEKQL